MRALSLVAIGQNGNYRLMVEWTLVFELFFYVVLFLVAAAGWVRGWRRWPSSRSAFRCSAPSSPRPDRPVSP